MFAGLSALVVSLAAASLIFFSWRQSKQAWAAAVGWVLAFGSAVIWSKALGPEIGVTYAIIVFVCLIWAEVALTMQAETSVVGKKLRPMQKLYRPKIKDYFKHSGLFLLSVPLTGVLTLMLSVALALYLPWSIPAKIALAIFAYPLLWGALSAWICAQDKLLKPSFVCIALLLVTSLILFI